MVRIITFSLLAFAFPQYILALECQSRINDEVRKLKLPNSIGKFETSQYSPAQFKKDLAAVNARVDREIQEETSRRIRSIQNAKVSPRKVDEEEREDIRRDVYMELGHSRRDPEIERIYERYDKIGIDMNIEFREKPELQFDRAIIYGSSSSPKMVVLLKSDRAIGYTYKLETENAWRQVLFASGSCAIDRVIQFTSKGRGTTFVVHPQMCASTSLNGQERSLCEQYGLNAPAMRTRTSAEEASR